MTFEPARISGLSIITPDAITDRRGFFMEVMRSDAFERAGLPARFVQVNHARSGKNVLRGLHFQWDKPLGKLIRVIRGSAWMAFADIRKKSPTFGTWFSAEISEENKKMVYAPPGFATGFCVLGDIAEVEYYYTEFFNPNGESSIAWNDPQLSISWPIADPILSDRDRNAQTLAAWIERPESDIFNAGGK